MTRETDAEAHGEAAPADEGGAHLVWHVFASPTLTVALLGLMVALGLSATQVPQGTSEAELLELMSFSWARLVAGFGLHHVLTSWPMMLLVVLLVLNVVALVLRAWGDGRRGAAEPRTLVEGSRSRAERVALRGVDASQLTVALGKWFSGSQIRAKGGGVVATRGTVREGLVFLGAGVVALVAAAVGHGLVGEDGRVVTDVAPLDEGSMTRSVVSMLREGEWVPGGPFASMACGPAAAGDPAGVRPCIIDGPGGPVAGPIAAGSPVWLPGLRISYGSVAPSPQSEQVRLELSSPQTGEAAEVYAGPGVMSFDLAFGGEADPSSYSLTVLQGPGGPSVALAGDDGAWILTGPAFGLQPTVPLEVRVVPSEVLTLVFSTTESRAVGITGALLVLLGLLAMLLPPHLEVRATPGEGGALVVHAASINRPERCRLLMRDLTVALADKES